MNREFSNNIKFITCGVNIFIKIKLLYYLFRRNKSLNTLLTSELLMVKPYCLDFRQYIELIRANNDGCFCFDKVYIGFMNCLNMSHQMGCL